MPWHDPWGVLEGHLRDPPFNNWPPSSGFWSKTGIRTRKQPATRLLPAPHWVLAAWRGQATEASTLAAPGGGQDATTRGEGRAFALAWYATAVLNNGLGCYEAAAGSAQRALSTTISVYWPGRRPSSSKQLPKRHG
jgi:hypothetical protein